MLDSVQLPLDAVDLIVDVLVELLVELLFDVLLELVGRVRHIHLLRVHLWERHLHELLLLAMAHRILLVLISVGHLLLLLLRLLRLLKLRSQGRLLLELLGLVILSGVLILAGLSTVTLVPRRVSSSALVHRLSSLNSLPLALNCFARVIVFLRLGLRSLGATRSLSWAQFDLAHQGLRR